MEWGTDWEVRMKFHHSLRFRIVITFCLFGTILCTLYGLWMVLTMTEMEDELFYHQLQLEIDHFVLNYQHDTPIPEPRYPYIKFFLGTDGMTDFEKEFVKDRGDGFYEYNEKDIHIAVKTLPNFGNTLYLIYEVGSLEIHGQLQKKRIIYLLVGLLLVAIVGVVLGVLTSRKIIAPIIQLADHVQKAGLEKIPEDLSKRFYSDEVGVLAHTFEQSMKRIEAFIEREKLFTRDASHELRTPITVIRGAVEVIQQGLGKGDDSIVRPLQRIEKAAKDMKNTVESFLWLARGEEPIDPGQTCDVATIVKETMEWHQNEVEARQITLDLVCQANPSIIAPPHIAQVLFSNLLRNAISFTPSGTITVRIEQNHVEVSDTGEGIHEDQLNRITKPYERSRRSSGFGLGLDIVQRLCDRFGWGLEIESRVGRGTTVRWVLTPSIRTV
jgi:signal transduction histidine kinase